MNRRWTIRARIITLLLAPVIPLLAMLVFATTVALSPALNLRDARISVDAAGLPAAQVVIDLQIERETSVINVSLRVDNQNETSGLTAARGKTDADAAVLEQLSSNRTFQRSANGPTLSYLRDLTTQLRQLPDERAAIDRGISRPAVMNFYDGLIETTFNLYGSIASLDDHTLQREADGVVGLAQASEFLAREDAIVAGMLASGAETAVDYAALVATVNTKRVLYDQTTRFLDGSESAAYQKAISIDAYSGLTKLENQLITKPTYGTQPPIDPVTWHDDYNAVSTSLGLFEAALAKKVIDATGNAATSQETRLIIVVGASLLMLLILVFFSIRIARSLIRRVAGLRMDALSLALDRLPSVVGRLRRGENVDLRAETPPLRYGVDELGQLGDAFTRVQETAITSAVQEANLRHGFNQVFLNIARRSQTLLHRQLALLDSMERRTEDPDQLEELFRVDHLATRMRRHAEDLVILAGSTPGRGWRNPVPFADVLRAAASEVEEYARISVVGVPDVGVAGRAVSDVVHLLAELLENATMFSPPETQVRMSGQSVPNGFVIEIEDRGLGMSPDALDDANARLASPPDFDPANSSRLGLFVVARLAARHGIAVALRRSPYGGVTAVTLIPADLVVAPSEIGPGLQGAAIGARLPAPRIPIEDDSAERTVAGAASTAVAVLDDSMGESTMALTMDGLPKRSRQASLARQATDPPGTLGFNGGPTLGSPPPFAGSSILGSGGGFNSRPSAGSKDPGSRRGESGRHGAPDDADHLERDGDAVIASPPDPTVPGTPRTPEQMRMMLASFQNGMALGRRDAAGLPPHADTDDAAPVNGTETNGNDTGHPFSLERRSRPARDLEIRGAEAHEERRSE